MTEFDLLLDKPITAIDPYGPPYNEGDGEDLYINATSTVPDTRLDIDGDTATFSIHVTQSTNQIESTNSELQIRGSFVHIEDRIASDNSATHHYVYKVDTESALTFSEKASNDIFKGGSTTDITLESHSQNTMQASVTFNIDGDLDVSELTDVPTINGFFGGSRLLLNTDDSVGQLSIQFDEGRQETQIFNANGVNIARFNLKDAYGENIDPNDVLFVERDGSVLIYTPCFLKGTHIATPCGEVKVETLKTGDKVRTASGGVATVKWVGYRTLYKNRIPAEDAVRTFPILFKKDSIAQNVPHRDLTLSPGHHVFFDGTLVAAMMLVNGQTIVQQFDTKIFEYFHVELEQFDIILAEGLPAESYVDTGNRNAFQNASEVAMSPDFGPAEGRPEVPGIKVLQQGPEVEAIRKLLLDRAEQMTGACRTNDAELCVGVNGQTVYPIEIYNEEIYRFDLPDAAGDVHILSRSAIVRETTNKPTRDLRSVGVGLAQIAIEDARGHRNIDLQDLSIKGFNDLQHVNGTAMRWTDGHGLIPADLIRGMGEKKLVLTVLRTYTYWIDANVQKAVRVA